MNIDDSFCNRVAIARVALNLTQAQLADMVGIVRRQIAAYEAGDSKPRDKVLHNLAAALGTTSEWLATGSGIGPNVRNVKKTITVPLIPIYTSVQTHAFNESGSDSSAIDFIPCPEGSGENAFAIIVQGDSMTSNGPISFPDGTIVTIDPNHEIKHGDFGLFSLGDSNESTFKQLVIDQGKHYLKALNHSWPLVACGADTIVIGKAVHSQVYIRSNNHVEYQAIRQKSDIEKRIEQLEELMSKAHDAGALLSQYRKDNKKPE
ncbi:helix-turn-helix domain-containing protein [Rosenbergiella sp. S61]|uniref:Helix-turn-helix domain-containing protein n=1 Tax=Rosenbergiella gaditana TaxID=2726987 RepID=A0ABS5SZ75_9GAMM|nr:XRE family transcriptional regulator [Rosenbergiella gaditana]MBT0725405.1 helix-turn-helix domain-containing protein [Rosenbergiella gaditana]